LYHEIFKYLDIKVYIDKETNLHDLQKFFPPKRLLERFIELKKLVFSCFFCCSDLTNPSILCKSCAKKFKFDGDKYGLCINCGKRCFCCFIFRQNDELFDCIVCNNSSGFECTGDYECEKCDPLEYYNCMDCEHECR
jgi:hypothetical protein